MKSKVRPSDSLSQDIFSLLHDPKDTDSLLSDLMRTSFAQVFQSALEAEVSDFLGREPYQRERAANGAVGSRNGYTPITLKTRLGRIPFNRPRVRGTLTPFQSRLLGTLGRIEGSLQKLAVHLYTRGLSTRDIERTFQDDQGKSLLSRSAVSELSKTLYTEYEAWQKRSLAHLDVLYLFADGVYESVRMYTQNQTLLCVWGICSDGTKEMLGLQAVGSESKQAWEMMFEDLKERGMGQPVLVISDGAKGLTAAIERSFPLSYRGRCLAHKMLEPARVPA